MQWRRLLLLPLDCRRPMLPNHVPMVLFRLFLVKQRSINRSPLLHRLPGQKSAVELRLLQHVLCLLLVQLVQRQHPCHWYR